MNDPIILAVTGNPILHSKSPILMNSALKAATLNGTYTRIAADQISEVIDLVRFLSIRGLNITAPFKQDVIPLLQETDPDAMKIGGINTVLNHDGCLKGYNTDFLGVQNSFKEYQIDLNGKKVLVIGAGGASRGAVHALVEAGAIVTIVNRTLAKARTLADIFNCTYHAMDQIETEVKKNEIILSTLSGEINLIEPDWLTPKHIIFDANYKNSKLAQIALQKKCTLIQGIDWLIHQAIPAFEYFTGATCSRAQMEKGLLEMQKNPPNKIFLIGFMGSGKTEVGHKLSEIIGWPLVDTDEMIETVFQKSIPEIFENEGEKGFRQKEKKILKEVLNEDHLIISGGGGIILDSQNRNLIKNSSIPVWLVANFETTYERTKESNRPLLKKENPKKEIKELFDARKYLYAQTSELVISTDHKTIEKISGKIYEEINQAFPGFRTM